MKPASDKPALATSGSRALHVIFPFAALLLRHGQRGLQLRNGRVQDPCSRLAGGAFHERSMPC